MEIILIVLPFAAMFLIMYLFMIMPEKKRKKQYNEMLSSLQKNDEIITKGGIIGKIVIIEDNSFIIETTQERTRLKITRTAIGTKLNKETK